MKKEDILKFCWDYVNAKAERLKRTSDELQESLTSETKSTAGDKHETGRAMVQLEQEKLAQQIQELEKDRAVLKKIDILKPPQKISLGCWVKTTAANYFISISAGAFKSETDVVYCISASAPIAQLLLGKEKGDNFVFNGNSQTILEVL
ncbi:3-oxoacyl-ACP synthase [Allomuricauda sp. NBRC 101325]|uniref:3-oxoacyl-ACP synthase n=1 Tax=Allomuricauda sp. NBRC 101325 TaxID=1113758 RepID=UPI0025544B9D|nr:3-oxoacyl-ACP synthase [Muricauda sp. NBRC 101325]